MRCGSSPAFRARSAEVFGTSNGDVVRCSFWLAASARRWQGRSPMEAQPEPRPALTYFRPPNARQKVVDSRSSGSVVAAHGGSLHHPSFDVSDISNRECRREPKLDGQLGCLRGEAPNTYQRRAQMMVHRLKLAGVAIAAFAFMAGIPGAALAGKCSSGETKATGKKASCKASVLSKAAAKGLPPDAG